MEKLIENFKKYHRASNYLSAAMLYFKDNFFLEEELKAEHIKPRVLGHWGTVPGLNFIYGALNILIKERIEKDVLNLNDDEALITSPMLITGPGHGAPAVISGLFLEETLGRYYSQSSRNKKGAEYILKQFSWPKGFPSHTWPGLPSQILEGGELGYSLGTAFGAVLGNPNLISFCVVGDGESETGTLSASWHGNKFLNHQKDGVVLPILHLNGYKISGPTVPASMSDEELGKYFEGLGYIPHIVDQYAWEDEVYKFMVQKLSEIYDQIINYKKNGGSLPILILRTKKGWTGPDRFEDKKIEDNNLSHGIPIDHPKENENALKEIEEWLKSYKAHELFNLEDENDIDNFVEKDIEQTIPSIGFRLGDNKQSQADFQRHKLDLPNLANYESKIRSRGDRKLSNMKEFSEYIRDVFDNNPESFRIFSPDESESNLMKTLYQETGRMYNREFREWDDNINSDGKIMEILSENVLQAWMEGYIKTGRNGILVSYEAFLPIITSQIDQYLKYLKQHKEVSWRTELPSLNYIATSTGWRQDHNGFTHQNPGLIHTLMARQRDEVSVYLPADSNIMLASIKDCLDRADSLNLLVAGKRDLPQWLSLEEAKNHVKQGISEWKWASNYNDDFDVVIVSSGDYQTQESIAACQILKEEAPELKFKYINVNELTRLGFGDESNPVYIEKDIEKFFGKDKYVIFNFHGYPETVKQLTWGTSLSNRMTVLGYIEQGSTTTPFDMQVVNKASRYHVCIYAVIAASLKNKEIKKKSEKLIQGWNEILAKHNTYIVEHGDDIAEVKEFEFDFEMS